MGNAMSHIWSDPWWWFSLALFIGGSISAIFLSRKGLQQQRQQERITRYLNEDIHNKNKKQNQLFDKENENKWFAKEIEKIRNNLQAAGFYHTKAIRYFLLIKFSIAAVAFISAGIFFLMNNNFDMKSFWMCAGIAFVINIMPDNFLIYRKKKQTTGIIKALPDSLELLVICLESGATLERSLDMVSEQLDDIYPQLCRQWQLTVDHMKVNPDRQAALHALANRTQITEMTALVTVLQQAEKFGSPLAQTLRNFSSEMRELRKFSIEERIGKLSSKITLPMLVLVFMPLLVIILAPQISMLTMALKGMQ